MNEKTEETPAEKNPEIQTEFLGTGETNAKVLQQAFSDITAKFPAAKVEVTDMEKALFMKGLLHDTPVAFVVSGFAGNISLKFKTRTQTETQKICDKAAADISSGKLPTELAYMKKICVYSLAVQCLEINGRPTTVTGDLEKDSEYYLNIGNENLLTAYFRLLAEFELKIGLMNSKILDGSFWKPADIS